MKFGRRYNKNRRIGEKSITMRLHHASSPIGKFELEGPHCRAHYFRETFMGPIKQRDVRGNGNQVSDTEAVNGHLSRHSTIFPVAFIMYPEISCIIGFDKSICKSRLSIHNVPTGAKVPSWLRIHAGSNHTYMVNADVCVSLVLHGYSVQNTQRSCQPIIGFQKVKIYDKKV